MTPYVVLTGWKTGLRKVALDTLLHQQAGLGPRDAFDSVNHLMRGEPIAVPMSTLIDAQALAQEARTLGAVAEVVERWPHEPAVGTREQGV